MGKGLLMCLLLFVLNENFSTAQVKRFYFTSGGELIFSSAFLENDGKKEDANLRFTGFINFNSLLHYNVSKHIGFYSGMELQNIGFIYKSAENESKTKFRTYNLGIPIGFKIGSLDKACFYTAYSLEVPIHYKEKSFVRNEVSHNISEWFSEKTPSFVHALSAGIQLPHGLGIKAKYYFSNFFSRNYLSREGDQSNFIHPDEANLFYFSITYNVFKSRRVTFNPFY
jgi:hypothetical protein